MSRVTTLPQISVEVDGVLLPGADVRMLSEVRVQQRLSQPTQCELVFHGFTGPAPVPGRLLRVEVEVHRTGLFEGEITAIEYSYGPAHERGVRLRAYDRLYRLRKQQSVRARLQLTPQDLARELVADLGLTVEAAEPGPLRQRILQHGQSDLALLAEVAAQSGLYLTLRGEVLHLLTLEGMGRALPLALGKALLEARVEINRAPACASVGAAGWNPLRVEAYEGRAARARDGRKVAAEVRPGGMRAAHEWALAGEVVQSGLHAEELAQAELDWRTARGVILWGVAEGDPRLRPGQPVAVSGLDEAVVGRYVLTAVTHTLDGRRGYVSELSTAPPPPQVRPRGVVVAPGRVTRVDDPESLGRIRVMLPTYGEVETDWMHVVSAGAGEGKGLVVLPNVQDHVLVLFSHEDPSWGIVLGGLYGLHGPPDSGVEDGSIRRYTLLTPGGQRIQLDDALGILRLENHTGSSVELSPECVRVRAAADLELEAPGRSIVLRGRRIDFEKA